MCFFFFCFFFYMCSERTREDNAVPELDLLTLLMWTPNQLHEAGLWAQSLCLSSAFNLLFHVISSCTTTKQLNVFIYIKHSYELRRTVRLCHLSLVSKSRDQCLWEVQCFSSPFQRSPEVKLPGRKWTFRTKERENQKKLVWNLKRLIGDLLKLEMLPHCSTCIQVDLLKYTRRFTALL